MTIVFWGQQRLTRLLGQGAHPSKTRIEALKTTLGSAMGHNCIAAGFWYIFRHRPQIVHVHGWREALLIRLAQPFIRSSTVVWTIDTLPSNWIYGRLAYTTSNAFDAVTVTTRTLQYQLLTQYSIRAQYIPDGYSPATLPDVPLNRFKLRKNQYIVALASSRDAIKQIASTYKKTKSRKKLITILPDSEWQGRSRRSIINGAAAVIIGDKNIPLETLLSAMDNERNIIAINDPGYQELLGVTGKFYRSKDSEELSRLLESIVKKRPTSQSMGLKAKKRAVTHFRWEKIASEYLLAYCTTRKKVPLDSVRAVLYKTHCRIAQN